MGSKAHVWRSPANDRWYWTLRGGNGERSAHNAEGDGFRDRHDAIRAFEQAQAAMVDAELVVEDEDGE